MGGVRDRSCNIGVVRWRAARLVLLEKLLKALLLRLEQQLVVVRLPREGQHGRHMGVTRGPHGAHMFTCAHVHMDMDMDRDMDRDMDMDMGMGMGMDMDIDIVSTWGSHAVTRGHTGVTLGSHGGHTGVTRGSHAQHLWRFTHLPLRHLILALERSLVAERRRRARVHRARGVALLEPGPARPLRGFA
eukprot:1887815-Prymnesium_polylepis.1